MADKGKKNLTVFGQNTEFDGVLNFSDSLVIMGKFNGKIESTGDLEIDSGATCNVESMKAASIEISGSVSGQIEATESVELCSGSVVKGDISAPRIRISDNVDYEGQVQMIEKTPSMNLFSVASDEYKSAFVLKSNLPR